jgi:hypothetical protein
MLIMPRKKPKVFQSLSNVEKAVMGVIRPRMSNNMAPERANKASLIFRGRIMIPSRVKTVILVMIIVWASDEIWIKKNIPELSFNVGERNNVCYWYVLSRSDENISLLLSSLQAVRLFLKGESYRGEDGILLRRVESFARIIPSLQLTPDLLLLPDFLGEMPTLAKPSHPYRYAALYLIASFAHKISTISACFT